MLKCAKKKKKKKKNHFFFGRKISKIFRGLSRQQRCSTKAIATTKVQHQSYRDNKGAAPKLSRQTKVRHTFLGKKILRSKKKKKWFSKSVKKIRKKSKIFKKFQKHIFLSWTPPKLPGLILFIMVGVGELGSKKKSIYIFWTQNLQS